MKYAVVLGDGMADWKIQSLGGKTCLEYAKTPNMDKLAPHAETGLFRTVPDGLKPGSDVANMSVMGFNPKKYYTGRSPLEAVAMGISLSETDVTMRANLVTLSGESEYEDLTMADYSAGEITTEEAAELINYLKRELDGDGLTLYPGISYRHCLVAENGVTGHDFTPPHDISDKKITEYLPNGPQAEKYLNLMKKSYELLKNHPINAKRVKEGKNPANSIDLSGKFSLNFETILPASDSAEKLWALENHNLRLINLKDSTISGVLIDNIEQISNYLTTVAYLRSTTDPITGESTRSINFYKEGESNELVFRTLEPDISVVNLTLGNYWGDDWIAYTLNNRFYLQIGSFPSSGESTSSLKTIAEHDINFIPSFITANPSQRLVAMAKDQQIATYDIELRDLTNFESATNPAQINWLDDFILWENDQSRLIVTDFNGANRRDITAISENSPAAITENNHWLYLFTYDETPDPDNNSNSTTESQNSYTLRRLRL